MTYKKYIQRNGKLYGPYIYESKRVDGKVVSEYHGAGKGVKVINVKPLKLDYKKILIILAGFVLLAVLIYFIAFYNPNKITGNVILGVDTSFEQGKPLDGVLKFSLKQGEFIPKSSKLVFENSGKSYEFNLGDVIDESSSEGNYYLEEKEIQGSGEGYGIEGERVVYPELKFVLQVYNEVEEQAETQSGEAVATSGETPEENNSNSAPITGNTVRKSSGFLGSIFGLTGMVSMELEKEVEGTVSKDKPFLYELNPGQSAELKPKSVWVSGEQLDDDSVSLNIEDNKVSATTDYSVTEKGYGKEYLGDKEKDLSLDLSDLNLILEKGDLNVKLVYENEELLSLKVVLEEGETTSGEIVEGVDGQGGEETNKTGENTGGVEDIVEIPSKVESPGEIPAENETIQEIIDSSIWDMSDFLTPQEKEVLLSKFGDIELKTVKSELFKDRIIRGYEIGEYSIEYSYDSSLSKDVLKVQMERDRIKFLKDIANSVLKEKTSPKILEGLNEIYTP
jgi:hypothetical protein